MTRISWAAERVLAAVLRKNEMGELPAKIGVCAAGTGYADCPYQMPARTRADRYRLIDRLIADGLIENKGGRGGAYALQVTDAGREAVRCVRTMSFLKVGRA